MQNHHDSHCILAISHQELTIIHATTTAMMTNLRPPTIINQYHKNFDLHTYQDQIYRYLYSELTAPYPAACYNYQNFVVRIHAPREE